MLSSFSSQEFSLSPLLLGNAPVERDKYSWARSDIFELFGLKVCFSNKLITFERAGV